MRKKKRFLHWLGISLLIVFLFACAPYRTITIDKDFPMPKEIDYSFEPVKASGKEIITIGTDKRINRTGFVIRKQSLDSLQAMSIQKANISITVAHVTFPFMKKRHGLVASRKHLLTKSYQSLGYVEGPRYAPNLEAQYRVNFDQAYQVYYLMPFYHPIADIYTNEKNVKTRRTFERKFIEGKVILSPYNPRGITPQEFKAWMEREILGQPYVTGYYKKYLVFYLRVQNLGKEKIRIWPVANSALLDLSENSQYSAIPKATITELDSYKVWKNSLKQQPKGEENPILGIVMIGDRSGKGTKCGYVYPYLPAHKSGMKSGDVITHINKKRIWSAAGLIKVMNSCLPGQEVEVSWLRDGKDHTAIVKFENATKWPQRKDTKILAGGNIYPGVIYDGYLIFDTQAMMDNISSGSEISLIIPSIGTEFTADDTAIHSFDFEFIFRMQ